MNKTVATKEGKAFTRSKAKFTAERLSTRPNGRNHTPSLYPASSLAQHQNWI